MRTDFLAEDRVRIANALNYNTKEKMQSIESAMNILHATDFDSVARVLALLDEIETCNSNLFEEMSSSKGSMTNAGPLQWSEYKFKPIISLLRLKTQALGVMLNLEPDYTVLDTLSKQYGLSHSNAGRLSRN